MALLTVTLGSWIHKRLVVDTRKLLTRACATRQNPKRPYKAHKDRIQLIVPSAMCLFGTGSVYSSFWECNTLSLSKGSFKPQTPLTVGTRFSFAKTKLVGSTRSPIYIVDHAGVVCRTAPSPRV